MNKKTIPLHPITSWQIGINEINNSIIFRPNYFDHQTSDLSKEVEGMLFALTSVQAQTLINDLKKQLDLLKKYEESKASGHFH